jgi:GTP-binding protein
MSQYSHARFLSSAAELAQFPRDTGVEVAFAGRSNAGKSSAINAILGRRGLARTSRTPGRTQLVNFFVLGEGRRLVDLPGYGYARVSEAMRRRWGELLTRYFRERRSLAGLFLIIDVRRRLTDHDRRMLAFAADCGLGVEILLTKADKLSRAESARALARVAGEVGEGAGVVLFSAVDGKGVEEGREALERMLARWTERPAAGQKKSRTSEARDK